MQVILLERVEKLGQMGDEVRVKDGFARNFLLPKKKALRATKANRDYFQTQKVQLEAHNLERKKDAEAIAKKLDGQSFQLIRQAGDRGQLYGSVSPRDVAGMVEAGGFKIDRNQVHISQAIKAIGAAARADIAVAIEHPVHLFLFVKVREGWGDDPERYREMGLEFPQE